METKLKKIYNWCKDIDISIFKGDVDRETNCIEWDNDDAEDDSLDQFLEVLTKVKPKFVVLNYNTFSLEPIQQSIKSTLTEIRKTKSNELLNRFEALVEIIKDKENQIYIINLSFIDNGFCFKYSAYAGWSGEYIELKELIDTYEGIEFAKSKYLINKETLKLAKELSRFELFSKATNKPQREIAASIFFKDRILSKKVIYNIGSIIEYGDSIGKMSIDQLIDLIETKDGSDD